MVVDAGALESSANTLIQRAVDEVLKRLANDGYQAGAGWLATRLVGPLWLASTFNLFPDADPLTVHQATAYGVAGQAQVVKIIFATVAVPPVGGPVSVDVQRFQGSNVAVLCTLVIPDGGTSAAADFSAGGIQLQAGDEVALNVTAIGATTPGSGLEVTIVTRVDVVRGDAWGGG